MGAATSWAAAAVQPGMPEGPLLAAGVGHDSCGLTGRPEDRAVTGREGLGRPWALILGATCCLVGGVTPGLVLGPAWAWGVLDSPTAGSA